jgi:hypothetical protein
MSAGSSLERARSTFNMIKNRLDLFTIIKEYHLSNDVPACHFDFANGARPLNRSGTSYTVSG